MLMLRKYNLHVNLSIIISGKLRVLNIKNDENPLNIVNIFFNFKLITL